MKIIESECLNILLDTIEIVLFIFDNFINFFSPQIGLTIYQSPITVSRILTCNIIIVKEKNLRSNLKKLVCQI